MNDFTFEEQNLVCIYNSSGTRAGVIAALTEIDDSTTLQIGDYHLDMMRYLQHGTLRQKGLTHFDQWASTFGETTTAIELAPEGTGYRARTRFAKFFNLPELMSMFKEVADIKTADQLRLLDWMREQMYGDTVTEWTYGNEHDRMSEAADFLGSLLSREGGDIELCG